MTLLLAGWLVTYLVHSTVLLAPTILVGRMLRRRESMNEWMGKAAVFAPVVTASIQFAGILPSAVPLWVTSTVVIPVMLRAVFHQAAPDILTNVGMPAIIAAVGLWLVVALAGLIRLGVAYRVFGSSIRDRHDVRSRIVAVHGIPVPSHVKVTVSNLVSAPLVLGTGEVCVPPWVIDELSTGELTCVLAHELAHLRRRDGRWLWLMTLTSRILWLQPLTRLVIAQFRAIAEYRCDDAACDAASRLDLASALSKVAARLTAPAPAPILAMASSDSLALARVRRILDDTERPRPVSRPGLTLLLAAPVMALALAGPRVRFPHLAPAGSSYTIAAYDDAGPFTVTLRDGRVQAVTINGVRVPSDRVRQNGNEVSINRATGSSFEITLLDSGGMRWQSRPRE